MLEIKWNNAGCKIRAFDDGHCPENLGETSTQLVEYPELFDRDPAVFVYPGAMPQPLVDAAYERTAESEIPAWGDYVTSKEIVDYWNSKNKSEDKAWEFTDKHLAVALSSHFIKLAVGEGSVQPKTFYGNGANATSSSIWTKEDFMEKAHGVAIWGLSAETNSEVPYHLDYAEQIRYDSNVIVPPLLAGTLQCTRSTLQGGDFAVSLEGLEHYAKHGYKAKKQNIDLDKMICIPYRFNQVTCHLGNLPHCSTKIKQIYGVQRRVIVGFNIFGHEAGPMVQDAPEHSERFRRKIKAQRVILCSKKSLSIENVKRNKPLSKLLVLAKREKIKQEYRAAKLRLENEIPLHLPATVLELMTYFSSETAGLCWPASPIDVQVYLHHAVQQGQYRVIACPSHATSHDLLSPEARLELSIHDGDGKKDLLH